MSDVGSLQVHRLGSHSLIWLDDLVETFPDRRPRKTMVHAVKVPGNKRHFPNKQGRIGVTVRGFRLISSAWSEAERKAVAKLYSDARSNTWRTTRAERKATKPEAETKRTIPPTAEPEQMADGEAIPPETIGRSESGKALVTQDFFFKGTKIRIVYMDGDPHWVGPDVCDRLEYINDSDAYKRHCRGVVKHYPIPDALGRLQQTRLLCEGDVFRLIMGSEKPEAEEFRTWVCDDVLPSIRKTGAYKAPSQPQTSYERIEDPRIGQLVESVSSLVVAVAQLTSGMAQMQNQSSTSSSSDQQIWDAAHDGWESIQRTCQTLGFPDKEMRHVWLHGLIKYNEKDRHWQCTDEGRVSGNLGDRPITLTNGRKSHYAVFTEKGKRLYSKDIRRVMRFKRGEEDRRQADLYVDYPEDPYPHDA